MCLTGSVQHRCFVLQTQPSGLSHPSQGLPGPENFPEVGVSRDQARTRGDAGETLSLGPSGSPPYSEEVQGRGTHGYQPHTPVLPRATSQRQSENRPTPAFPWSPTPSRPGPLQKPQLCAQGGTKIQQQKQQGAFGFMKRKNKKPSPDILPLESADSEGPAGNAARGLQAQLPANPVPSVPGPEGLQRQGKEATSRHCLTRGNSPGHRG